MGWLPPTSAGVFAFKMPAKVLSLLRMVLKVDVICCCVDLRSLLKLLLPILPMQGIPGNFSSKIGLIHIL